MGTVIEMPQLSDTMTKAVLVKWLKQPGERVRAGEMLAEVETDKATLEIEAPVAGVMGAVFFAAGDEIAVGQPIAELRDPDSASVSASPSATSLTLGPNIPLSPRAPAGEIKMKHGAIQASGLVKPSNLRRFTALRLLESKTTIPHFYIEVEVDAGPLLEFRDRLNGGLASTEQKLSLNDFILWASVEALRAVPAVNSSWENDSVRYHGEVNLSFAVAVKDGLITPVIRNAHTKSLRELSVISRNLAARARERKLLPEEVSGGTFCVSNLGMKGVRRMHPIINPPNAAILGVGAVVAELMLKDGTLVAGQRLSLTLSCDHRVLDGVMAADFLAALRRLIEHPDQLAE